GGGAEDIDAVLGAVFAAQVHQVRQLRRVVAQDVHGVGVVPEHPETGAGDLPKPGDAIDHDVAVDDTARVCEARHAPDALDLRIGLEQRFDLIHVGAVLVHGHGNQLDAEVLTNRIVTVVA